MASNLNSKACDLKHRGTSSKHCEVLILSMKPLARLKDQDKSLLNKMLINEINFIDCSMAC